MQGKTARIFEAAGDNRVFRSQVKRGKLDEPNTAEAAADEQESEMPTVPEAAETHNVSGEFKDVTEAVPEVVVDDNMEVSAVGRVGQSPIVGTTTGGGASDAGELS